MPAFQFDCQAHELPPAIARLSLTLEPDAALAAFLDRTERLRPGRLRTGLQRWLSGLVGDFDANALLGMYPMHLLSTEQWKALLEPEKDLRLLDVGAGSGDVSLALAPLFCEVVTTEVSRAMAFRLRRRGLRCELRDVALSGAPDPPYDVVSCLNVLDRSAHPRSLLDRARDALVPSGRLVVALALPYSPFYYAGGDSLDPIEALPLGRESWTKDVSALIDAVLEPLGFELEKLARAPYISGGDAREAHYVLDDAIVIARRSF